MTTAGDLLFFCVCLSSGGSHGLFERLFGQHFFIPVSELDRGYSVLMTASFHNVWSAEAVHRPVLPVKEAGEASRFARGENLRIVRINKYYMFFAFISM